VFTAVFGGWRFCHWEFRIWSEFASAAFPSAVVCGETLAFRVSREHEHKESRMMQIGRKRMVCHKMKNEKRITAS
jgi:hypothetical protein